MVRPAHAIKSSAFMDPYSRADWDLRGTKPMVKQRSLQSEQTADLEYSMACEHSPEDVRSGSGRDDAEK